MFSLLWLCLHVPTACACVSVFVCMFCIMMLYDVITHIWLFCAVYSMCVRICLFCVCAYTCATYYWLSPICRNLQSWLMRRTWKEFRFWSMPTSRTWPPPPRPARSQRASTCTHTVTASGRSRPARQCLGKECRYAMELIHVNSWGWGSRYALYSPRSNYLGRCQEFSCKHLNLKGGAGMHLRLTSWKVMQVRVTQFHTN